MANWHLLLWGKDKLGAGQAKEGDIIDVLRASTQWAPNNKETQLCIIVPVSNLTRLQAMALKRPGVFLKHKYKISFNDLQKIHNISKSDIRDDKKYYQPFIDNNIITDISKANIVLDKNNEIINMSSIELRL